MRNRILPALTAAAVAAATFLGAGPAAATDSIPAVVRPLSIKSFGGLVVDGVHRHVFIADPVSKTLLVTDYSGATVATLTGITFGTALRLSADSSRLYVAEGEEILAYDTTTLTQVGGYALGVAPESLAEAGGKLWFGYAAGGLGSFDGSQVALFPHVVSTWTDGPDELAGSPAAPGLLAASVPSIWTSDLAVLDVSSGTPVVVTERTNVSAAGLRFTPDGGDLVTGRALVRVSDLTDVGQYPASGVPEGLAVADDGTVAMGVGDQGDATVDLFAAGGTTVTKQVGLVRSGTAYSEDIPGGLAWEPDSTLLFAVARSSGGTYSFQVLNDPALVPVTLTLEPMTGQETIKLGDTAQIFGSFTANAAPVDGPTVEVTRVDSADPNGVEVGTATFTDGSFQIHDRPPVSGTVTYSVSYPGDDNYAPAQASTSVTVTQQMPVSLTLNHGGSTYSYGTKVSFTAHLIRNPLGTEQMVSILNRPAVSTGGFLDGLGGAVDANGYFTTSLRLTQNMSMRATFNGDAWDLPTITNETVYVHAGVATSLARQYKTTKSGSVIYYYFHQKTNPYVTTTINAYAKRKQYLTVEYLSGGTWHLVKSGYYTLSSAGKSYVTFTSARKLNVRYRVRAAYLQGKSGDSANVTTYGAYQYFYFTK